MENIRVGPYLLKPIPSTDGEEAILDFNDEWEGERKAANPIQEARFMLSWLAVALIADRRPGFCLALLPSRIPDSDQR